MNVMSNATLLRIINMQQKFKETSQLIIAQKFFKSPENLGQEHIISCRLYF